jgi:UDP-N-acetylmuramate dehydrogenase
MDRSMQDALSRLVTKPVQWDCPLSGYTSFAIGGPAQAVLTLQGSRELQDVLAYVGSHGLPWRVIGKGTNLLVPDAGFDGIILVLGSGFKAIEVCAEQEGRVVIAAGAGCGLTRLSGWCTEQGLSGLEFACGIPGTVGGAVVMNAGAWGSELAEVLTAVVVVSGAGPQKIPRRQMQFSYRCWQDHGEKAGDWVVAGVEIGLVREDPEKIRARCSELLRKRREKQPKGLPNAGSFFKNPAGDSAGRLIEKCGCKGMQVGGAMVSPVHANFLVNTGHATAADVMELMDRVQKRVRRECGVLLEPEVHFL